MISERGKTLSFTILASRLPPFAERCQSQYCTCWSCLQYRLYYALNQVNFVSLIFTLYSFEELCCHFNFRQRNLGIMLCFALSHWSAVARKIVNHINQSKLHFYLFFLGSADGISAECLECLQTVSKAFSLVSYNYC